MNEEALDLEKAIVELRDKGFSFREISKKLGVSNRDIARVLREHEKKKLVNDPISLLEEKAEQEERRVKALQRLKKAREQLAEPGLLQRLVAFEVFVTKKLEDVESRIAKIEDRLKSVNGGGLKSFKDEIQDLAELEKLNLLGLEIRRRTWGW